MDEVIKDGSFSGGRGWEGVAGAVVNDSIFVCDFVGCHLRRFGV